jgi:hypothetical protein
LFNNCGRPVVPLLPFGLFDLLRFGFVQDVQDVLVHILKLLQVLIVFQSFKCLIRRRYVLFPLLVLDDKLLSLSLHFQPFLLLLDLLFFGRRVSSHRHAGLLVEQLFLFHQVQFVLEV